MEKKCLKTELSSNAYPGRGIVIGKSEDGTKAVTAYFIMGRSCLLYTSRGEERWGRH